METQCTLVNAIPTHSPPVRKRQTSESPTMQDPPRNCPRCHIHRVVTQHWPFLDNKVHLGGEMPSGGGRSTRRAEGNTTANSREMYRWDTHCFLNSRLSLLNRNSCPMVVGPRQRHSTADDLGLLVEFSTRQVIMAAFSAMSPTRPLPPCAYGGRTTTPISTPAQSSTPGHVGGCGHAPAVGCFQNCFWGN